LIASSQLKGFGDHPIAKAERHIGAEVMVDTLLPTSVGASIANIVVD
jgi:hypothetical protein